MTTTIAMTAVDLCYRPDRAHRWRKLGRFTTTAGALGAIRCAGDYWLRDVAHDEEERSLFSLFDVETTSDN